MTGRKTLLLFLASCAGLVIFLAWTITPAQTEPVGLITEIMPSISPSVTPVKPKIMSPTLAATVPPLVSASVAVSFDQATPTWTWLPPGSVQVPVLLYHHVSNNRLSRYYVSRQNFEAQIAHLNRMGYTAIPVSLLVEALLHGANLPPKPILITFDDGYQDVLEYAFPVMQHYGYVGTVYIITDQLGVAGYMDVENLLMLVEAGWEVGSHTKTHNNLRQAGVNLVSEIVGSRQELEKVLEVPVNTFSYPYGLTNRYITRWVEKAGYQAAVGLGQQSVHTRNTRYYLSRKEIQGDTDLVQFAQLVSEGGAGVLPAPLDFPPSQ